jgi:hypothetical protein
MARFPWGAGTIGGFTYGAAFAALLLAGARPAHAFHFQKESEDSQRIAPQPQEGEPGGPQTSVGGDLGIEFAEVQVAFFQSNDCSASCDAPECSTTPIDVECTTLQIATFTIEPDPGETIGAPVTLCFTHSYELSVTTTGNYSGYAAVGGVPTVTVDPTLVTRTPGGVELSNGPVQITGGTAS